MRFRIQAGGLGMMRTVRKTTKTPSQITSRSISNRSRSAAFHDGKDGKDLRLRAWVRFSAPPQPRFVRPMNIRSADTSGVEPHRRRPHRNREGGAPRGSARGDRYPAAFIADLGGETGPGPPGGSSAARHGPRRESTPWATRFCRKA